MSTSTTKILVIGPSWVGDMVMSQPLYTTLKDKHPNSRIDVLAPQWCKPILERMPEVNKSLEMQLKHGELNLPARLKIGISLRKEQYDIAYILPKSAKSALIPFFAKIPKRIGWRGEVRYGLLTDLRSNMKDFQYMVERYVALAYPNETMLNSKSLGGLEALPRPSLQTGGIEQHSALAKFRLSKDDHIVGLCPGAEFGPAKKWPSRHFSEVATYLREKGKQIWLFGSEKDVNTCEKIKAHVPLELQSQIHVLAGKTTLIEAVDLLAACKTIISNDSGLMHVAAAVNCNVVAIYGSTSPKYTPPLAKNVKIIHTDIACRPCFKRECPFGHLRCLSDLSANKVIEALEALEGVI